MVGGGDGGGGGDRGRVGEEGVGERRLKGGWGCIVVLAEAAGVMDTVYGSYG